MEASDESHAADNDIATAPSPGIPEDVELCDEPLDGTNDSGTHDDLSRHDEATGAQFSAGDEWPDPMAESLARALHDVGIGGSWLGDEECPAHEEDEVPDYKDPFYSEGKTNSITAFPLAKFITRAKYRHEIIPRPDD